MTLIASRMVGFPPSVVVLLSSVVSLSSVLDGDDCVATFSFQRSDAMIDPSTRKTIERSKGPVGPRFVAAVPANSPASIATMESPA